MKRLVSLVAVTSLVSGSALAAGLQKSDVSAKAKWLIHLDGDAFRSSQLGTLMARDAKHENRQQRHRNQEDHQDVHPLGLLLARNQAGLHVVNLVALFAQKPV